MPDIASAADEQEVPDQQQPRLIPLQFPQGFTPERYTPWQCSPEPIYGPDELGEFKVGVEEMCEAVSKCDAAARMWEVLQAWEMRLFRRGYHFLTAGYKGWGMFGGSGGTPGAAASIMQTQNTMKLFACNTFGG